MGHSTIPEYFNLIAVECLQGRPAGVQIVLNLCINTNVFVAVYEYDIVGAAERKRIPGSCGRAHEDL